MVFQKSQQQTIVFEHKIWDISGWTKTYEITDNTTLVLSDFGTIKISEISDKSIVFSVKLTTSPNSVIKINDSKQDEIKSSTKTDLLCRTWEMISVNGVTVKGTSYEGSILFSASGTYFVSVANSTADNQGGLAQWKWKDDSQTKFFFSWDEVPIWDKCNYMEISKLSSDSLKIVDEQVTYVLIPKSTTHAAARLHRVAGR